MKIIPKGIDAYSKYMERLIDKEKTTLNGKTKYINQKEKEKIFINTKDIFYLLNNKNIPLLVDFDNNILITFENFSNFEYFINKTKRKLTKKNISHEVGYDSSKNHIFARRNFLDKDVGLYPLLKKEGLDESEIMNFVLLHEIGHSIHDTLNKNDKPFVNLNSPEANFINSFTKSMSDDWFESPYDIMRRSNNSIAEGFADLYASILVDRLYPKEQSSKIINAVFKSREYLNKYGNEKYNTFGSIKKFIDYRHQNPNTLRKYEDIEQYIFKTTLEEAFISLKKEMHITYDKHEEEKQHGINFFAGVIYQSNNLASYNVKSNTLHTLDYISKHINLPISLTEQIQECLSNRLYDNNLDCFEAGREKYIDINKPEDKKENKVKNGIRIFKKNLSNDEKSETNRFKLK